MAQGLCVVPGGEARGGTDTAAYLPGKWGEARQKEFGASSSAAQCLGSVRTNWFEDVPLARAKHRYPSW